MSIFQLYDDVVLELVMLVIEYWCEIVLFIIDDGVVRFFNAIVMKDLYPIDPHM